MRYLVTKNKKLTKFFLKNEIIRLNYKSIFYNRSLPNFIRQNAAKKLFNISQQSSLTYLKVGCLSTYKNRSVFNKFKTSRIKLRVLASNNYINGLKKK